jgi:hypothetical protein
MAIRLTSKISGRNGRGAAAGGGADERRNAALMSLILTQKSHAPEPGPTKVLELPKVVELEDASSGKDLETLLRERLAAVREVIDGPDRPISETELQGHGVTGRGAHDQWMPPRDGCPCEKVDEIDEMTCFPHDTPATNLGILCPVRGGIAPALTVSTNARGPATLPSSCFIVCTCGEKRRLKPTVSTGRRPGSIAV